MCIQFLLQIVWAY